MKFRSILILVLLSFAAAVALATAQDVMNAEQTPTSSEFSQTLTTVTTWTLTDQYGTDTFGRVCGNVPWNDSISAHCGDVPIPEFSASTFALVFVFAAFALITTRRGQL